MPNTILFICTGNYYRSRFAEIFFNDLASKMGIDWKAESRGLAANEGYNEGAISKFALERLTQRGILPGDPIRFPMQLEEKDLREAGHIIVINRVEHQPMMEKQFPAWAESVIYWDVADLHLTNAENALSAIEKQVHSLMENINTNP